MIEAVRAENGQPRAKVSCDTCAREDVITAAHERGDRTVQEGQAIRKLTKQGWSYLNKTLRCPSCEAKRKAFKVVKKPAETDDAPREPTRQQRREIMDMLEEVYDTDAERYRGVDSDETVADVLKVMPGWVARIREEFFGANGGSDDMDALRSEVEAWTEALEQQLKDNAAANALVRQNLETARDTLDKLERIRKAVGPRVLAKAGL